VERGALDPIGAAQQFARSIVANGDAKVLAMKGSTR
jgi:hypothetical protein